eukprot:g9346.t1
MKIKINYVFVYIVLVVILFTTYNIEILVGAKRTIKTAASTSSRVNEGTDDNIKIVVSENGNQEDGNDENNVEVIDEDTIDIIKEDDNTKMDIDDNKPVRQQENSNTNNKINDQGRHAKQRAKHIRYNPYVLFAMMIVPLLLTFCRQKLFIWTRGILFMMFSMEKRGMSKAPDTDKLVMGNSQTRKVKTIVFIRHGESDWNEIFNKSKVLLLPRLIRGLFREAMLFMSDHSVFIDSPLSKEGVQQAEALQKFITGYKKQGNALDSIVAELKERKDSVLVSSNLRRAINTGCIAMWPRMKGTYEKIILLSSLQEMSRNVDTNALAGPNSFPEMSLIENLLGKKFRPGMFLETSSSYGNKGLCSTAYPRMMQFCEWCMTRDESTIIVSAGHSLWFKNFFKVFLPKKSEHHAKTKKIHNCGAVSFKLVEGRINGKTHFKIDEESILEIWRGFKGKPMAIPRALASSIDPRMLSKSNSGEPSSSRELSGDSINVSSPTSSNGSFVNDFVTVKEGMLEKKAQTHVLRGWQHRYFKLEKDSLNNYVLRYFADEAEAKKNSGKNLAKKDKSLDKLKVIQKVDNTLEFNLVFEGDRSNLHLKAKNAEDYAEWTDLLFKTKGIGFLASPTK